MPTISNLGCLRSSSPSCLCIGAGTIAANDLRSRVFSEPVSDRLWLPIGKKVEDLACFQIAKNGPVTMALLPCPVIDAENAWTRHHVRLNATPQLSKQRGSTRQ
jgi:hypothetical protein